MTFQPCRPATIKLLPYERAPFGGRSFFGVWGGEAAAWAQNVWTAPRWLEAASIGQAVRALTALQRNWRGHALPESGHQRRQAFTAMMNTTTR